MRRLAFFALCPDVSTRRVPWEELDMNGFHRPRIAYDARHAALTQSHARTHESAHMQLNLMLANKSAASTNTRLALESCSKACVASQCNQTSLGVSISAPHDLHKIQRCNVLAAGLSQSNLGQWVDDGHKVQRGQAILDEWAPDFEINKRWLLRIFQFWNCFIFISNLEI